MERQIEENLTLEQINKIDLFILSILKEGLLDKNLDFIDIMDYFNDQTIMELNCNKEIFQRRTMYNFGLGYMTLMEVSDEMMMNEDFIDEIKKKCKKRGVDFGSIFGVGDNGKKLLTKKNYYSNFLEAKITALGLKYIEELEKQLEEMKGFGLIANKFSYLGETFSKMKVGIGIGLTVICLVAIFIFDMKVSKFIEKIPLLSSIINTDVLETFESVNENDEFYKSLSTQIEKTSPSILRTLKDIKVKKVNDNEKIFKITLFDGQEKFVNIIKDSVGNFKTNASTSN